MKDSIGKIASSTTILVITPVIWIQVTKEGVTSSPTITTTIMMMTIITTPAGSDGSIVLSEGSATTTGVIPAGSGMIMIHGRTALRFTVILFTLSQGTTTSLV